MKRAKRWLFTTATVLLLGLLASTDAALPFKKVSIAKTPASTTSTTTTTTSTSSPDYDTAKEEKEESELTQVAANEAEENKSDNATLTKNSKLTGIPQIDYIWDPNLPRELRGYNLSTYPFLSTVPPMDEIHFKCEGLHDGFYASIEYKCQIYHHCVYGIRHDFLCANFTAFDQRTFICHFASDVDCEGSQKYWNRNDELYMATTTSSTSTTTTTTEAPPSQPRRRAQRPNHRPYNRRPVDDYYDEDEYEDDYYEKRGQRRKLRPRLRKPLPEYDDEYDEDEDEVKPTRRNRNRNRDEDELSDEYSEERRSRPGARRGKPTRGKKASTRKPGRVDERRSFSEDRERERDRERAINGRRRLNEKRTTPSTADVLDELDEYEKPYGLDQDQGEDQEEAAEEQQPQKVKTTPRPLSEFVTPKAAPASVYARPRAPPRIARPVPITEKKKYSYPVQKSTPSTAATEDYYEDPVEEQVNEDDYEQPAPARRRTAANREQTAKTRRKPVTEHDQESRRKRPAGARAAPRAPPDFVDADEDYEEQTTPAGRQRVRLTARKPVQRPRQEEEEPVEEPVTRSRVNTPTLRRQQQKIQQASRPRVLPTSRTTAAPQEGNQDDAAEEPELVDEAPAKPQRPAAVRVVKRPFLPSRGGSPYLPRGLQPVGVAQRQLVVTESTPLDMGSTISGVRLLEHGAPLLRGNTDTEDVATPSSTVVTLPPQPPKPNLDELYGNDDYDVTLNDALDPTLKPLTPQQHSHPHPQQLPLQSRHFASAYAAPASAPAPSESVAYNPFAGHYQQASIYPKQNQNQNHQSIASALQSQSQLPSTQARDCSPLVANLAFTSTRIRCRRSRSSEEQPNPNGRTSKSAILRRLLILVDRDKS
ncbi:hypothetical protein ACLKA7_017620 [Drosophila subpalustris]